MKTGKLLMALLIVALLVVYYLFGTQYLNQRQQQAALTLDINDVARALSQMPEPPPDLNRRLATARTALAEEQRALPTRINSTSTINTILKLADECQVKATPLITHPWSTETIGSHDYQVFRLSISVKGSFLHLVTFINNWRMANPARLPWRT
jgi:cbb3-type cytochrome oxidase subunit 3